MKYVKLIICVLLAAGMGFVSGFARTAGDNTGQHDGRLPSYGMAADTLKRLYQVKKAEQINSRKIRLYCNGELILEDDSLSSIYMNDRMELCLSASQICQVLSCEISALDDENCRLHFREQNADIPLEWHHQRPYISLTEVCQAMELYYDFDEDQNCAKVIYENADRTKIPEQYDLRTEGRVPKVVSQGGNGTCWAFAALSALGSTLLPEEQLTFSVDHLTMNNGFNLTPKDGGDFLMALAYMASWKGPVFEADDPYGDGVTNSALPAVRHLQGAVTIQPNDFLTIKKMILEYGGVQSSFYSDIEISSQNSDYYNMNHASYYYNGTEMPNHDIVIVGWDDHFPKENFNREPAQDGAFICQNSWGTEFGEGGYFYISYEDTNIGVHNLVYTQLESSDNYGHIYQADELGWLGSIGYGKADAWFANIYTSGEPQKLSAVSFFTTGKASRYEIYAVPAYESEASLGSGIFLGSGYLEEAGYHTVEILREIPVSGQFAVKVYISTENAVHPVAIEYANGQMPVDLSDGQGYISYDGTLWQNAETEYECNICLKAFTEDIQTWKN